MTIFLEKICRCKQHSVRWAGAGAGGVREKYCWLAGGWKLVLERCERKTLLGWRLLELPNRVIVGLRIPALIPPRPPTAPYRDLDEGKTAAAVLSMILLVCIFKMDSGWMDLEFGGGGLDWIG